MIIYVENTCLLTLLRRRLDFFRSVVGVAIVVVCLWTHRITSNRLLLMSIACGGKQVGFRRTILLVGN